MKTEQDYDKAFQIVKEAVHAWDPYRLIELGAPDDEYDSDIASLLTYLPKVSNEEDFRRAVSNVFGESFGQEAFTEDHCTDFAQKLFCELKNDGLLSKVGKAD